MTGLLLLGCAGAVAQGERFGIKIWDMRGLDTKLRAGSLVSDDKRINIQQVRSGITYFPYDDVRIPEGVDFMWQPVGGEPQVVKLKVRSQIPRSALEHIHTTRNVLMVLEFFVREGTPQFRWLVEDIAQGGAAVELARGGDWSK